MADLHWFKDAVIYELHIKTFQDSNADGIGDFGGLLQRLDYFTELGVTAIWLLPFYPSPLRDDGYDIADYYSVNPSYGTLDEFRTLLEEAHNRGLRVITELVLNHTSDQNAWFQRARNAPAGSPERDFYVWSDNPKKYRDARIIFKDFETSNWTWDPIAKSYFWHRFYSHQPDLNFENPLVQEELIRVIDYWLEMGVDGLRLDAVPYLYEAEGTNCENLPETHAFLKKIRAHMDEKFPGRMLLAEANQWPEDAAEYFGEGDECHMEFHFPLMPRMFMSIQMEDRFPIIDILDQTPAIPDSCQWAIFLRNHDELTLEMVTDEERDYMYRVYAKDPGARINLGIRRRLAPLLDNNRRKIELINSLLFSLPGTPVIYYGDEIGMGDNFYLGDRNGVRTPMQWSPDRNAGFSKANPQRLYLPTIIDPDYHYESVNVENQQRNLSSLFWWMRRLLSVRKQSTAFARGSIEFLHPDNAKVLAFVRRHEEEVILVIANLSRFTQFVELNLSAFAGYTPVEMFGHAKFPEIHQTPMVFTLGPHGFSWFSLKATTTSSVGSSVWTAPTLAVSAEWGAVLKQQIEQKILRDYLPTCRWFGGKSRVLRETKIVHEVTFTETNSHLFVVEVAFTEGMPERYLMPLSIVQGEPAKQIVASSPQGIVAFLEKGEILCDSFFLPEFREHFLRLILEQQHGSGVARLSGITSPGGFDQALIDQALIHTRIVSVEQSNTSVIYGDVWFLKFFRKFEHGIHPDLEISQFLCAENRFDHVPAYAGAVKLIDPSGEGVIAMLVNYTQHQGDGWSFTLDAVSQYFDRVLEARAETDSVSTEEELIGLAFPERMKQLAEITAKLHLALASASTLPDFSPEPFSTLYQRSLYQAMRGAAGRVLRQLSVQKSNLPESIQEEIEKLLVAKEDLYDTYAQFLDKKIEAVKIRVHGDLHLGQVLNTGKDFVIIDFEGEPSLSLGERRIKRSPLRDVAGILRSFDYAVSEVLRHEREDDARYLETWAHRWVEVLSKTFLETYLTHTEGAEFLPPNKEDTQLLLDVFVLQKAVYEIGYELSYRPDFVGIPLRAVRRLIQESKVKNSGE